MKRNFLLLIIKSFFLACLLAACASKSPISIEKASLNASQKVVKLNEADELRLNYRFKNSMTTSELKSFYKQLDSAETLNTLSPKLNQTIENSVEIASKSLFYSDIWEKALASGDVLNTAGGVILAGAAIAALAPEITPLRTISYHVPASLTEGLSDMDVTMKSRHSTLESIKIFLEKQSYEVICEEGCIDNFSPSNAAEYTLWAGLKNNNIKTDFFRPTALKIKLNLLPLVKSDLDNMLLLGEKTSHEAASRYGWAIEVIGPNPWSEEVEKNGLKYQDLRLGLEGTMLHRKLFEFVTSKLLGFSYMYRGSYNIHYHVKEAYYNGKTYELYDEFSDNSLVKGIIKS